MATKSTNHDALRKELQKLLSQAQAKGMSMKVIRAIQSARSAVSDDAESMKKNTGEGEMTNLSDVFEDFKKGLEGALDESDEYDESDDDDGEDMLKDTIASLQSTVENQGEVLVGVVDVLQKMAGHGGYAMDGKKKKMDKMGMFPNKTSKKGGGGNYSMNKSVDEDYEDTDRLEAVENSVSMILDALNGRSTMQKSIQGDDYGDEEEMQKSGGGGFDSAMRSLMRNGSVTLN